MASTLSITQAPVLQRDLVPILGRKCVDSAACQWLPASSLSPAAQCIPTEKPTDLNNNLDIERYKTEMCHNFKENGFCKYGTKCQFAHFQHEVRSVSRHPKYKTEMCRTYHMTGLCRYGTRCHFVHDQQEPQSSSCTSRSASPMVSPSSTSAHSHLCSPAPDTAIPEPLLDPLGIPSLSAPTDSYTHLSYASYATNLYLNTDPMDSFTTGLSSAVSTGNTIVQDCLGDMCFTPMSPVCQSEEGSQGRLPVFLSLCDMS